MKRNKNISSTEMNWRTVAYCDQMARYLAVYDTNEQLRAAMREESGIINVVLFGDNTARDYRVYGALGTTDEVMGTMYHLYEELSDNGHAPKFMPGDDSRRIRLSEVFTHSAQNVAKHGRFEIVKSNEDIRSAEKKMSYAMRRFDAYFASKRKE